MRSNIRYVHPDTSAQLRRYEQRIRQLEAQNGALQTANWKLGQHILELNECHGQKAQLLQDSLADLNRKLESTDQHYSKLLAETRRFSDEQATEIARLTRQLQELTQANQTLKTDEERLKAEHDKLKQEQQDIMVKYYEANFELEVWALRWASYEQEAARVSDLSLQYQAEIAGLRQQLRELTDLKASSVQNSGSQDQSCRVLADIINRHVDIPTPLKLKQHQ